jgi:hypothetical protein
VERVRLAWRPRRRFLRNRSGAKAAPGWAAIRTLSTHGNDRRRRSLQIYGALGGGGVAQLRLPCNLGCGSCSS